MSLKVPPNALALWPAIRATYALAPEQPKTSAVAVMAQDETKIKTVLGLMGRGGCRRRRSILKIKGHHEMSQEEEFSRDQARSDKLEVGS